MLIACPNCATAYQLDAAALGTRGRSVRCVRCRTVWFVAPAPDQPAAKPEPASEEAAFGAELGAEAAAAEPTPDRLSADAAPAQALPMAHLEPAAPEPGPPLEDQVEPIASSGAMAEPVANPATEHAPDIVEVAPVALSDISIPMAHAPPVVPAEGDPYPVIDNGASDVESVARRRRTQAQRARARWNAQFPVVVAALVLFCGALIGLRKDMVRHMPQLASFYASIGLPVNLRGLSFADLKLGRETHDGVPVLAVEGTIVNGVARPVEVPRLRFALHNAAGAEVYAWTAVPSQSVLEPGERLAFRSRLASPPDDGAEVQVRFFTRGDAVAGVN